MMSFLICGILFFYNKNLSLALTAIFNGVTALCVLIFCLGFIEKIIESKENKCLFKKTWVYKNIPLLSISFFFFTLFVKKRIILI
jgi:phosphatidylinositol kinase/protein kinase (PI-3  family)